MTIAILFIVLLLIGVPVAFTLGLTALAYIALETPLPPLVAFQRMFTSVDSFPFVAIPFFMLAGNLMGAGGLATRIINLARALVGHLRGGLANATVVSNMFMGGISGSSVADCSALGSILIPAMEKQGYAPRFAGAVNATASTMGIIHPPEHPDDPDGGGHEPLHPRPLLRGAHPGPADRPGDAGDHDVHLQAQGLPEIPARHRPRAAGGVFSGDCPPSSWLPSSWSGS